MGTCQCAPPAQLHLLPTGVHLPGGEASSLVVVDEAVAFDLPRCSVCANAIPDTYYRCVPCDAVICRACVAVDTAIVECDCISGVAVTGVQVAALRAAAALR
jgi:hypothetical protein